MIGCYAIVGWAWVRYGPHSHVDMPLRSGTAAILSEEVFGDGREKRLVLYVQGIPDLDNAYQILEVVQANPASQEMVSLGIVYVVFWGIWPFTITTSAGFVFAKGANGAWYRADNSQLAAHMEGTTRR